LRIANAERRRWAKRAARETEDLAHLIDDQRRIARAADLADVDHDPLRLSRQRGLRHVKTLTQIDDGHDLNAHRIHDFADEKADEVFRRIVPMARHQVALVIRWLSGVLMPQKW